MAQQKISMFDGDAPDEESPAMQNDLPSFPITPNTRNKGLKMRDYTALNNYGLSGKPSTTTYQQKKRQTSPALPELDLEVVERKQMGLSFDV
jgi:hypothetical protein